MRLGGVMEQTSSEMGTRTLGAGGPEVSTFGLGTMTFGVETDEAGAFEQLDWFVERGGTLVDTADVYGANESERIIGRWLAARNARDRVVLSTKGRFASPDGVPGASRHSIEHSAAASLQRLGVDAIDVYFVHGWDQDTPVDETLDALTGLIRAGHIRSVGWSNVTGWQLQRIVSTARLGGFVVPVALQPQYNLLDRGSEWDLIPCCLEEQLGVTPWSPLGGGWLTGKYRRDERPSGATRLGDDPNRGVEAYDVRNEDRTWRILDAVQAIAHRHGRPMSHVALAWLTSRPSVTSVLLGARTTEQLTDNLGAAKLVLDAGDLDELTRVSAPGLPPYPYGMVEDFCDVPHWRSLGTRGEVRAERPE